jgi:hypothetical protein
VAAVVAEVGEVAVVVVAGTVAAAAVVVTLLPTRLLLETTDAGRRVAPTYCPFNVKDFVNIRPNVHSEKRRFAGLFVYMID